MPNMTLIKRIELLAETLGVDVKSLITTMGLLSNLDDEFETNSSNGNLVQAINYTLAKAKTAAQSGGAKIKDDAIASDTTWSSSKIKTTIDSTTGNLIDDSTKATDKTWSSNKISSTISSEVAAIVDSAPEAFDTLKEVAEWINGNASAITAISNKVPYNETKDLTDEQKQNVWTTIGIGNYADSDFVAKYEAAKA